VKISRTQKVIIQFGHDTTAGQLAACLLDIPNEARMAITHYPGDQRDPSYTTITFTWPS
jgi:hypothetical protein